MIDERDLGEVLRRRADAVDAAPSDPVRAIRRARRRQFGTGVAGVVAAVAVAFGAITGAKLLAPETTIGNEPSPSPVKVTVTEGPLPQGLDPATVLPPDGAEPSEPLVGEHVVGFYAEDHPGGDTFSLTQVVVYADGRVIWHEAVCRDRPRAVCDPVVVPEVAAEPTTGWLERRLTPAGVELLRSELLSSGLFEHDLRLISNGTDLADYVRIDVRNGGRYIEARADYQGLVPDPPAQPEVETLKHLQDILLDLDAWLPDASWEDRRIHAFIPARYGMWFYPPEVPADLPPPADELVGGRCTILTPDEARAVVAGFDERRIAPTMGEGIFWASLTFPVGGPTKGDQIMYLEPLLPDRDPCS